MLLAGYKLLFLTVFIRLININKKISFLMPARSYANYLLVTLPLTNFFSVNLHRIVFN